MISLFAELGGLASFLFASSRILTQKVARNWFIGSLTESLFRVRNSLSLREQTMVRKVVRQETKALSRLKTLRSLNSKEFNNKSAQNGLV